MTFGHPDTFDSTRSFSAAASSGSLLCLGMFWFDVVCGSLVFSWVFFWRGGKENPEASRHTLQEVTRGYNAI